MIAIHTKYLGPTNTRGSRVKAYTADGRSVIDSYDHSQDSLMAHYSVALVFMTKHLAPGPDAREMRWGDSADGKGYVFCFGESKVTA